VTLLESAAFDAFISLAVGGTFDVRVEPGVAGLRLLHRWAGGSPDADIGSGAANYVLSRLRLKDDVLRPCVG